MELMDRETGLELADWLAHMQRVGQTLAHLDAGKQHLAKLELWEKMVREAAEATCDEPRY